MRRLFSLLVAALLMSVMTVSAAQAISANGFSMNTFFAYVQTGEKVNLAANVGATGSVQVRNQNGEAVYECSGNCVATLPEATEAGVWVIDAENPGDNRRASSFEVIDADEQPIPGRIWGESIKFGDSGYNARAFTAYFLSEFGALYQAEYRNVDGWAFEVLASNRGIMHADGSCLSTYFSTPYRDEVEAERGELAEMRGEDYTIDGTLCRDQGFVNYRVFYDEPPAADLPETVTAWGDGRTNETWVVPTYQAAALADVQYHRDGFTSAGTIQGVLSGQSGELTALIDTNNNGVYTDPEDISMTQAAGVGSFSFAWDGVDGTGAPVPATQDFGVRVELEGEAEIHFVIADAEGFRGGLEVELLNTPAAGPSALSWDDSRLPEARSTEPEALIGVAVPSAGGVHKWSRSGIPWGDKRFIDNWTFQESSAEGTTEVGGLATFSLGTVAFFDADQNGIMDDDEPRLGGITVNALDASGEVVASTTTAADGTYEFVGLFTDQVTQVGFDLTTVDIAPLSAQFGIVAAAELSFTQQILASDQVTSTVDPDTGVAVIADGADEDARIANAGVKADGQVIVQKITEGPVAGSEEFSFATVCTDFRGNAVEIPDFTLTAGSSELVTSAAGVACVISETDAGGAALTTYTVEGSTVAEQEAPEVLLTPTASAQTVTVTNVFEEDAGDGDADAGDSDADADEGAADGDADAGDASDGEADAGDSDADPTETLPDPDDELSQTGVNTSALIAGAVALLLVVAGVVTMLLRKRRN